MTDEIKTINVGGKEYILHRFPAIFGYEVLNRYGIVSEMLMSDYAKAEELIMRMLAYVSVIPDNGANEIPLKTRGLIDNHISNGKHIGEIVSELMNFNFDFFPDGETLSPAEQVPGAEVASNL